MGRSLKHCSGIPLPPPSPHTHTCWPGLSQRLPHSPAPWQATAPHSGPCQASQDLCPTDPRPHRGRAQFPQLSGRLGALLEEVLTPLGLFHPHASPSPGGPVSQTAQRRYIHKAGTPPPQKQPKAPLRASGTQESYAAPHTQVLLPPRAPHRSTDSSTRLLQGLCPLTVPPWVLTVPECPCTFFPEGPCRPPSCPSAHLPRHTVLILLPFALQEGTASFPWH